MEFHHSQEIYSKKPEDTVVWQTQATRDEAELAFRVYKMLDGNEAFSNVSEFHVMPVQGEDGSIISVQVTGIQGGEDSEGGTLHTQVFDIHELGDAPQLLDEAPHQEREEPCVDVTDEPPVSPVQSQDVSQETNTQETNTQETNTQETNTQETNTQETNTQETNTQETPTEEPQETAELEESPAEPSAVAEITVMQTLYKCGECKFSSCHLSGLRRHMRRHSDKHKCKLCEKTFGSATELRLHNNVHLGIKPHKCSECEMAYGTAADLLRHTRSVHRLEKPFRCYYCDYTSAEVSRMKIHIRSHTGERPFSCLQCSFATTDAFKLRRHTRTHTGEKPYSCHICQAKFTQSTSMKMHVLRKHTENLPKEHCPICNSALFGKYDVQVHIRKQHSYLETPMKCRFCPETFHERYILRQHQQSHKYDKPGGNRPGNPSKPARCKKNDEADEQDAESGATENGLTWKIVPTSEETQLYVHVDGAEQLGTVTELHSIPLQVEDGSIVQALVVQSTEQVDAAELHAQVYELQDLGEVLQPLMEQHSAGSIVFTVNSSLDQPIVTELEQAVDPNGNLQGAAAPASPQARKGRRLQLIDPEEQIEVKLHQCKDCDEAFSTGLELVKHKKSHKPENQFKCPFCQHETTEAVELILHIQIHSEDRPFHCEHCNFAATDAFKLNRHRRTHTGERPFSCSVCQIAFTQKSTMEMHVLRKHTKELPKLQCPLCDTVLTGKMGLKIHIRKQHAQTEKALKCRFCPDTFHERFVLRQHQKDHQKAKTAKSESRVNCKRKAMMKNSKALSLITSERTAGPEEEELYTWQVVPAEQETEIHLLISGSEEMDAVSEYHVLPVQTEDGSIIGIPVAGLQEVEQVEAGAIHTQVIVADDA